jgi:phosphatase NudJ
MAVIPIKEKIVTQPFVVVGVILEKDNKFVLVQEGRVDVGAWNIPAGWLDLNEEIVDGAKREVREETGLEIEITGFLGVYASCKQGKDKILNPVRLIFTAKPLTEKLNYPQDEILSAKWFSYEEIKRMKDKLRSRTIIPQIEDYLAGNIYPLEVIKPFIDYTQK